MKIPRIWLGEEHAYQQLVARLEGPAPTDGWYQSAHSSLLRAADSKASLLSDEDSEELSLEDMLALQLIEVYDNVGLIKVEGPMTSEESFFNLYFGEVAYATIGRAINMLLAEESVSDIVLAFSSPGGDAEGIGEASDAIISADRQKPVYAWSGSSMQSGAYWLGASARKVYATKVARVGSIGAVATFVSRYRQMKDHGLDAKIVRSTPLKAVPHPMEKLTQAGEQQLEKEINFYHSLFTQHVASRRGQLSLEGSRETWASGATFFGEEALQMGLIDGPLMTVDTLLSDLITAHNRLNSAEDPTMARRFVLGEANRAAISAGLSVPLEEPDSLGTSLSAEVPNEEPAEPVAPVEEPPPAAAAPETPATLTAQAGATPVGELLTSAGSDLGALLMTQMEALRQENATLREQLTRATLAGETQAKEIAGLQGLMPVVTKAIERLEVGLGHRKSSHAGATPQALAETYETLYGELMNLPTGRQSIAPETPPATDLNTVVSQRLGSLSH